MRKFSLTTSAAILAFATSLTASLAAPAPAPAPQAASQPQAGSLCLQVKNPGARDTCLTAVSEYRKGNYTISRSLMKKASDASPKEGILRVELARISLKFEGYGPAERQLLQARKDGAPDHEVLPVLFFAMVGLHKEVTLLDQFPEPAPNAKGEVVIDILKGRAQALESLDRVPEAAAELDRALSLSRDSDGLLFRATLATKQKDAALAKKLIDEAYRLAPHESPVMAAKLEQLEKANDSAGVLVLADEMQKLYPINSDPREAKIRVYLKQNQDAKAKAELDAYMAFRPKSPLGIFYRAVLTSRAHNKMAAAQLIQSLPPDFVRAHPEHAIQMAQISNDNGNPESAASILGAALGAAPDMIDVRLALVSLRLSQDSPQSALLLLNPVKDSHDPQVQKLLTQVRARLAKDRT
ncbi:MAG TPA: tetratricopeptide repeat protein [Rhizomicrobium sp.]|nr:tetratricopeptide repeat protein [Rhizomicrobium sp.]